MKMVQNRLKMVQIRPKWVKTVQNQLKMTQNRLQMAQMCPKWCKMYIKRRTVCAPAGVVLRLRRPTPAVGAPALENRLLGQDLLLVLVLFLCPSGRYRPAGVPDPSG